MIEADRVEILTDGVPEIFVSQVGSMPATASARCPHCGVVLWERIRISAMRSASSAAACWMSA
ncbi:hypothetical protein [Sphingomonas sp. LM7]|uniref:hypothetical protein n=1 Tax=Sphingomonas sp. LM7 TaxID=1938607 RepID=UPI00345AFA60